VSLRTAHTAIARVCQPSTALPAAAAADIANEIVGALCTDAYPITAFFVLFLTSFTASACSSGLKVLDEDIVMHVVDTVKSSLVKGGKCPSSEFVPERERERLRCEAAGKVTAALADYCSSVPKSAADIITGYTCFHSLPWYSDPFAVQN
jgi:hypothetical protein